MAASAAVVTSRFTVAVTSELHVHGRLSQSVFMVFASSSPVCCSHSIKSQSEQESEEDEAVDLRGQPGLRVRQRLSAELASQGILSGTELARNWSRSFRVVRGEHVCLAFHVRT